MLCIGGVELCLRAWSSCCSAPGRCSAFSASTCCWSTVAFRANYRAARAYEEVTVTASELTVRKVNHRGGVREWTLNPLWVRLDRIVHEEFGIERLFLVSRGRRLPIAGFLGPDEKASFARALSNALGEAKRGPTRTVLESVEWRMAIGPIIRHAPFAFPQKSGGLRRIAAA